MTNGRFTVDDLTWVNAAKLDDVEAAEIERAVIQRETLVADLQSDLLAVRSERDAFQRRIELLEDERQRLEDRIGQLEVDRPKLETGEFLADFGRAVEDVRRDVEETGYTIGDVEFDLKANVVSTDEGVRLHLPSLDEDVTADALSDIRFRVDRREPLQELDYEEIPDLRFRSREAAERQVEAAGFSVGAVEFVPGDEPDVVVEQFPSPYSVAPPDTDVDLVVTRLPADDEDDAAEADRVIDETEVDGRAEEADDSGSVDDEEEAAPSGARESTTDEERSRGDDDSTATEGAASPRGAGTTAARDPSALRIDEVPDVDRRTAGRLREAGVADADDLATADPATVADAAAVSEAHADELKSEADALIAERAAGTVDELDGIGHRYAGRLERVGVRSVDKLATKEPEEVAEATGAPPKRVAAWIDQARERVKRR